MDPERLSHITTLWTLVRQAHRDPGSEVRAAQQALLDRYGGAIRSYLRGALRDADAADELFQEFAYRFLHGDLRNADRGRGRFRDYVRGVLFHLIADHHNQRRRQPMHLEIEPAASAEDAAALAEADRQFLEKWRAELLARAWGGLSSLEQATGQPYYTVLRFRADHPDLRSHQIAEQLGAQMGRPLTAVGVRQALHRARDKFAELLLYEVQQSLEDPSPERLEQELLDLGLHDYCRSALGQRQSDA